jgi:hypothetical protein
LSNLSWPVLDFISALGDPNAAISYIGFVSSDQGQAFQIRIQESHTSPGAAQSKDYFIDPSSFLIVETKDTQSAAANPSQTYSHSVLFSGYSNLNGMTVPLSITELVSGQRTWVLQLNTVTFNVGLTDADFQL